MSTETDFPQSQTEGAAFDETATTAPVTDVTTGEPDSMTIAAEDPQAEDVGDEQPREDPDHIVLREHRIENYLTTTLESVQPEIAVLGGVAADLMTMELWMTQSVMATLTECQNPREYLEAGREGMEMVMKLSRQAERVMRLNNELARRPTMFDEPLLRAARTPRGEKIEF